MTTAMSVKLATPDTYENKTESTNNAIERTVTTTTETRSTYKSELIVSVEEGFKFNDIETKSNQNITENTHNITESKNNQKELQIENSDEIENSAAINTDTETISNQEDIAVKCNITEDKNNEETVKTSPAYIQSNQDVLQDVAVASCITEEIQNKETVETPAASCDIIEINSNQENIVVASNISEIKTSEEIVETSCNTIETKAEINNSVDKESESKSDNCNITVNGREIISVNQKENKNLDISVCVNKKQNENVSIKKEQLENCQIDVENIGDNVNIKLNQSVNTDKKCKNCDKLVCECQSGNDNNKINKNLRSVKFSESDEENIICNENEVPVDSDIVEENGNSDVFLCPRIIENPNSPKPLKGILKKTRYSSSDSTPGEFSPTSAIKTRFEVIEVDEISGFKFEGIIVKNDEVDKCSDVKETIPVITESDVENCNKKDTESEPALNKEDSKPIESPLINNTSEINKEEVNTNSVKTVDDQKKPKHTNSDIKNRLEESQSKISKLQQSLPTKLSPGAVESLKIKYSPRSFGYPKIPPKPQITPRQIRQIPVKAPIPAVRTNIPKKKQETEKAVTVSKNKTESEQLRANILKSSRIPVPEVPKRSPSTVLRTVNNDTELKENTKVKNKDKTESTVNKVIVNTEDYIDKKTELIPKTFQRTEQNFGNKNISFEDTKKTDESNVVNSDNNSKVETNTDLNANNIIKTNEIKPDIKDTKKPPIKEKPVLQIKPFIVQAVLKKQNEIIKEESNKVTQPEKNGKEEDSELPKEINTSDEYDSEIDLEELKKIDGYAALIQKLNMDDNKKIKKRSNSFKKLFSSGIFGLSKDKNKNETDAKKTNKVANKKCVENKFQSQNLQNEGQYFSRNVPERHTVGHYPVKLYRNHSNEQTCSYNVQEGKYCPNASYSCARMEQPDRRYIQYRENEFTITQDPKLGRDECTEACKNNLISKQRCQDYICMDNRRYPLKNKEQPITKPGFIKPINRYIDNSSSSSTLTSDNYENQRQIGYSDTSESYSSKNQNKKTNRTLEKVKVNRNSPNPLELYVHEKEHARDPELIRPKAIIPINTERPLPNPYRNTSNNDKSVVESYYGTVYPETPKTDISEESSSRYDYQSSECSSTSSRTPNNSGYYSKQDIENKDLQHRYDVPPTVHSVVYYQKPEQQLDQSVGIKPVVRNVYDVPPPRENINSNEKQNRQEVSRYDVPPATNSLYYYHDISKRNEKRAESLNVQDVGKSVSRYDVPPPVNVNYESHLRKANIQRSMSAASQLKRNDNDIMKNRYDVPPSKDVYYHDRLQKPDRRRTVSPVGQRGIHLDDYEMKIKNRYDVPPSSKDITREKQVDTSNASSGNIIQEVFVRKTVNENENHTYDDVPLENHYGTVYNGPIPVNASVKITKTPAISPKKTYAIHEKLRARNLSPIQRQKLDFKSFGKEEKRDNFNTEDSKRELEIKEQINNPRSNDNQIQEIRVKKVTKNETPSHQKLEIELDYPENNYNELRNDDKMSPRKNVEHEVSQNTYNHNANVSTNYQYTASPVSENIKQTSRIPNQPTAQSPSKKRDNLEITEVKRTPPNMTNSKEVLNISPTRKSDNSSIKSRSSISSPIPRNIDSPLNIQTTSPVSFRGSRSSVDSPRSPSINRSQLSPEKLKNLQNVEAYCRSQMQKDMALQTVNYRSNIELINQQASKRNSLQSPERNYEAQIKAQSLNRTNSYNFSGSSMQSQALNSSNRYSGSESTLGRISVDPQRNFKNVPTPVLVAGNQSMENYTGNVNRIQKLQPEDRNVEVNQNIKIKNNSSSDINIDKNIETEKKPPLSPQKIQNLRNVEAFYWQRIRAMKEQEENEIRRHQLLLQRYPGQFYDDLRYTQRMSRSRSESPNYFVRSAPRSMSLPRGVVYNPNTQMNSSPASIQRKQNVTPNVQNVLVQQQNQNNTDKNRQVILPSDDPYGYIRREVSRNTQHSSHMLNFDPNSNKEDTAASPNDFSNPEYGYIRQNTGQFVRGGYQRSTIGPINTQQGPHPKTNVVSDVIYENYFPDVQLRRNFDPNGGYAPIFKRGSLQGTSPQAMYYYQQSKKVSFSTGTSTEESPSWPSKNGFVQSPPSRRNRAESSVSDNVFLPADSTEQTNPEKIVGDSSFKDLDQGRQTSTPLNTYQSEPVYGKTIQKQVYTQTENDSGGGQVYGQIKKNNVNYDDSRRSRFSFDQTQVNRYQLVANMRRNQANSDPRYYQGISKTDMLITRALIANGSRSSPVVQNNGDYIIPNADTPTRPLPPVPRKNLLVTKGVTKTGKNAGASESESGSEAGEVQKILRTNSQHAPLRRENSAPIFNRGGGPGSGGGDSLGPRGGPGSGGDIRAGPRGGTRLTRNRDDPRRHTLSGDQHGYGPGGAGLHQGGVLARTMDLEFYAQGNLGRGYPGPGSNAMLFDDDPGIMSEVETSSTGFRRGGKQRSSLPVVRTPSKTLERPLGLVFLQYRNETKRALLPNEITSIDTVKALFVRSFPKQLTMEYLDSPHVKIYIHDSNKDMFYELEDLRSHLRDIRDRSVLRLFESTDVSGGLPGAGTGIAAGLGGHFEDQSYFSEPEFDSEFQHQHIHKSKSSSKAAPPYYIGSTGSLPRGGPLLRTYSPAVGAPVPADRIKTLPGQTGSTTPTTVAPPPKPVRTGVYSGSGTGPPPPPLPGRYTPFLSQAELRHTSYNSLYSIPDGYMSSPERGSRGQYEDPYYSQYGPRSGSITPVIDEEARIRVEHMERQLANLTGLVQKALTQAPSTPRDFLTVPGGRDNFRSAEDFDKHSICSTASLPDKSVSFEKSVSFSDEPPDMNSPKQHSPQHTADTKPPKPAIKSSTLPRTSSQERDRLKPAPPPKPAALTAVQYEAGRNIYRDLQLTPEMYNQLRGLQKKAKDLRAEVRNLRRMSQAQAHSVRETIRDTFIKIRTMLIVGGEQAWQAGIDHEKVRLNREEDLYKQEMLRLEKDLTELESTVEELRGNVINRKTRVNMSDVENMALILSKSSKTVADLKVRFPNLQEGLKGLLTSEMEKAMREEKFLKEEPERLESALRRCKKLTGTLVTLKRLASVQEQRLPCSNSTPPEGRLSPTADETPPITPTTAQHGKSNNMGALGIGGDSSIVSAPEPAQRPENALDALLDELQTFSRPHDSRKGSVDSHSDSQSLTVNTTGLRRLHSYPSGSDTDNSPPIQPVQPAPRTVIPGNKPPLPERNAELIQAVANRRVPPPPPPRTSSRSPLASPTSSLSPGLPPRAPINLTHIQNVQNMTQQQEKSQTAQSQFEQARENLGLNTLRRNVPGRSSLKEKAQTLPRNIGSNLTVQTHNLTDVGLQGTMLSASNSSSCESVNSQEGNKKSNRQEQLELRHQELLKKQKALQEQYARLQQLQRGNNALTVVPPTPDLLLKKTGSESNLLQKMGLNLTTTGSLTHLANTGSSSSNPVTASEGTNTTSSSTTTSKVYETDIL